MNVRQLLDQKSMVETYLEHVPKPLSSFSFVSLFAWGDFFDFEFKTIDDCLCIFAHGQAGSFLYLPPLGKHWGPSTVEKVFKHLAQGKPKDRANRIENIPENLLSALKLDGYNQYAKPAEYVYRKADLVALKGNAYKSQRHDCNHFIKHHAGHAFGAYQDDDFDACVGLYERWAKERGGSNSDDIYRSMLQENRLVHERLLKFAPDLGIVVRILKVDGKIAGYTFGFALDQETFCIYAEIADLKITGSAAYMFKSFCADSQLKAFSRINTMDDFAMPNVAAAKQAWHPSELIHSYTLSIKE